MNYTEWSTKVEDWRYANGLKIRKYGEVSIGNSTSTINGPNDEDLNEIKQLLNNGYVLSFGTCMSGERMFTSDNKASNNDSETDGTFKRKPIYTQVAEDNGSRHAMTIVGYNDDIWVDMNNNGNIEKEELGAFKVANSWGADSGDNGFMWYAYDSLNSESVVEGVQNISNRRKAFDEITYVNTSKIGQPKLSVEFTVEHARREDMTVQLFARNKSTGKEITKRIDSLSYEGGAYPFNGYDGSGSIGEAVEATFALSYDVITNDSEFFNGEFDEIGIILGDCRDNRDPLKVKAIKLVDGSGKEIKSIVETNPIVLNKSEKEYKFDYIINSSKDELVKPSLKLDELERDRDGNYKINFDGSQPNGKLVKYKLYENNQVVKTAYGDNFTDAKDTYQAQDKKDGKYIYRLEIEDENRNVSVSPEIEVNVSTVNSGVIKVDEGAVAEDGVFDLIFNSNQKFDKEYIYELCEIKPQYKIIKSGKIIGNDEIIVPVAREEGIYTYGVRIKDSYGSEAYSNVVTVVVDKNKDFTRKPTLSIDNVDTAKNGTFTINYDGSQPDGTKVKYKLYMNGDLRLSSGYTGPDTEKGSHKIENLSPGIYEFVLEITDLNETVSDKSEKLIVNVGTLKKPSINVDELTIDQDGHYNINFDGTQPDGTLLNYELYQNGKLFRINSSNMGNAKASIPFSGMANGVYEYYVIIKDLKGNTAQSDTVKVIVNKRTGMTVEPRIYLDSPLRSNDRIGMTLNFGNSTLAKSKIELYEDYNLVKSYVNTSNEVRFETTKTDKLNHRYKLVVTDELGFKHESEEVIVYYNRLECKLNKPSIYANTTFSRDGVIKITVDASNSTEKVREFYLLENDKSVLSATGYQKITMNAGIKPNGTYEYQVIAFDSMLNGIVTDKVVVKVDKGQYEEWELSKLYKEGNRVVYNGSTYECIYEHTSQPNWAPSQTAVLWKKIY